MMLAQIDEAVRLTDHASQQGVNWFLVGSNIVLGTAMVWMAKVFRARHDKVCGRLDTVQDDYTANLKEMNTRQAVIISEHTVAATKLADRVVREAQRKMQQARDRAFHQSAFQGSLANEMRLAARRGQKLAAPTRREQGISQSAYTLARTYLEHLARLCSAITDCTRVRLQR